MSTLKVDAAMLHETANAVRGFIDECHGATQTYLQGTQNLMGAGGWDGPASRANLGATEQLHHALTNLTARWTGLAEQVDAGGARYDEQERANTVRQASVGQ